VVRYIIAAARQDGWVGHNPVSTPAAPLLDKQIVR
jgi:hypothetical protein